VGSAELGVSDPAAVTGAALSAIATRSEEDALGGAAVGGGVESAIKWAPSREVDAAALGLSLRRCPFSLHRYEPVEEPRPPPTRAGDLEVRYGLVSQTGLGIRPHTARRRAERWRKHAKTTAQENL